MNGLKKKQKGLHTSKKWLLPPSSNKYIKRNSQRRLYKWKADFPYKKTKCQLGEQETRKKLQPYAYPMCLSNKRRPQVVTNQYLENG